jgi:hypothetical protein
MIIVFFILGGTVFIILSFGFDKVHVLKIGHDIQVLLQITSEVNQIRIK